MPSDKLRLEGLTKHYGELTAVDRLSLSVEEGELFCLLGPSGCGKSTALQMISGLTRPTSGSIFFDGENVTASPAYDRNSSMVFQSWALFPHKTVLENVAFGLKMDRVGKDERRRRAREALELVQLEPFADHRPSELSGGQKQRTALARSLVVEPSILLLDEPLSNLDRQLREQMQIEIANIQDQVGKTMIYVTHDQNEAFTLADRIGIMNGGRLIQTGRPRDVYANPRNEFVERFLGDTNFVEGKVSERVNGRALVETPIHSGVPVSAESALGRGTPVKMSLRPEEILLTEPPEGSDSFLELTGTVTNLIYRGSTIRYYVDVNDQELFFERRVGETDVEPGDEVTLSYRTDRVNWYSEAGEKV